MLRALASLLLAASPKAGELAPDFTVKDTDGVERTLSKMVQDGPVVLAFYPKAFTGGCTTELTAYRDRYAELAQSTAQILAISSDDLETQKRFKASLGAPYPFIADADAKLITLYDVKTPVVGYARRTTFVIGKDRRVVLVDSGNGAIDPKKAVGAAAACR